MIGSESKANQLNKWIKRRDRIINKKAMKEKETEKDKKERKKERRKERKKELMK